MGRPAVLALAVVRARVSWAFRQRLLPAWPAQPEEVAELVQVPLGAPAVVRRRSLSALPVPVGRLVARPGS